MLRQQLAAICCFATIVAAASLADAATEDPRVEVESVVLRLLEEAEVPAQEAGVVTAVAVREGQHVKEGDLLTQVDDQVARLAAEATQAQYDIAHAKATSPRLVAARWRRSDTLHALRRAGRCGRQRILGVFHAAP